MAAEEVRRRHQALQDGAHGQDKHAAGNAQREPPAPRHESAAARREMGARTTLARSHGASAAPQHHGEAASAEPSRPRGELARLVGPAATMKANEAEFKKMIKGAKLSKTE